jgi:hypothetical protein
LSEFAFVQILVCPNSSCANRICPNLHLSLFELCKSHLSQFAFVRIRVCPNLHLSKIAFVRIRVALIYVCPNSSCPNRIFHKILLENTSFLWQRPSFL